MKTLRISLVALTLLLLASTAVYAAGLTATIVSPAPNASVALGQTFNLQGLVTDASGGVNYVWSFNDGTTNRGGQNQTVTFATAGAKVITLTVGDGSGASDVKTVSVVVTGSDSSALVITNIRITDITSNSAVIRWTTNRVADSRVIYDTVSHPSLTGATSPNYGYANSTGTSDNTTKVVEHAVTVSGLSASTHYFFRVISAE